MKFFLIAGEASGDLHGANLIRELKNRRPKSEFKAWGGDRMEAAGAEISVHYRELAFMGFVEVIANLRTILKNIEKCKKEIEDYQPDAVIFIDYPGFNMRLGQFVKDQGIKVFYYISPQIWAWKQKRVYKLRAFVDQMFVILPFEKEFYGRFGMEVNFVGHPLLDAIGQFNREAFDEPAFRKQWGLAADKPIVALLPGSRKQEVRAMLQVMLQAVENTKDTEFVVAGAPSLERSFYEEVLKGSPVKVVQGNTYGLLRMARAALVTSGTATLETALFNVPQVVCYKGNFFSYLIARQLVKIKYISLVNLIMDRVVVRELIQNEMTVKSVRQELNLLLNDESYRTRMQKDYTELKQVLGGEGASGVTADLMLKTLSS